MEVWGNKSSIYLGGFQFFYAAASCIGPLIETNYLTNIPTNQTYTSSIINVFRLEVPFAINGVFLIVSAILLLLLYCYRPYIPPKSQEKAIKFEFPKKWELIYILLGVFIIGPYAGLELMNFQLIPTFLQDSYQHISDSQSSQLLAILTGVFAITRLINFVVAIKYWTKNYIYVNLILIFISNILLFLYEYCEYSEGVLMAGLIIMGIGFSTVYPSVYTFFESQLTLSNTTVGVFISAGGILF